MCPSDVLRSPEFVERSTSPAPGSPALCFVHLFPDVLSERNSRYEQGSSQIPEEYHAGNSEDYQVVQYGVSSSDRCPHPIKECHSDHRDDQKQHEETESLPREGDFSLGSRSGHLPDLLVPGLEHHHVDESHECQNEREKNDEFESEHLLISSS